MSKGISISKIGQKIFTPKTQKTVSTISNPFSVKSFKGNVLTADVFETKTTKKNKLTFSTFVGSIGDAFPTYRKAIESVTAFGKRMKSGFSYIAGKINEIGNTEITIDFAGAGKAIKSGFGSMFDSYSVGRLKNYDVATLEGMWKELTKSGIDIAA